MKKEAKEKVIRSNRERLYAFVLRARFISEHIIKGNLKPWQDRLAYQEKMQIIENREDPDNITTHVEFGERNLLPFVDVISALALCRPVFLQQDVVYYQNVFKAIKTIAGSDYDDEHEQFLKPVREQFVVGDYSKLPNNRGADQGTHSITDKDITSGWIYGFLLHDDAQRKAQITRRELKEDFHTITYRAANQLIAIHTLYLYLEYFFLGDERLFPDPSCWSLDVTIPATYKPTWKGQLYFAPVDTPMPRGGAIANGDILADYQRIDNIAAAKELFEREQ